MLGQNLRPVQGALTVQITSVVSPSVARPGDSFIVKVNGDYSSSGPFTMVLSIVQLNGVPAGMGVGTDTYTSSIQPPETGTWGLAPTLQAYTPNPNEYDSSGKFAWQLEVEVNGVSQKFTVTIIKADADPYIKIVGVDAETSSGTKLDKVSVEESFTIVPRIEYSFPAGSIVTLSFRNYPPTYNEWQKQLLQADGWVQTWWSSPNSGSGVCCGGWPSVAPTDPMADWHWGFKAQVKTSDPQPRTAEDHATLHLAVTEPQDPWAAFAHDESAAQAYVQPTKQNAPSYISVYLIGKFIFPGTSTGTLMMEIFKIDNTLIPDTTRTLPDLKGKSEFSESYALLAPTVVGEFDIIARLYIITTQNGPKLVDTIILNIQVGPYDTSYFCKITGVEVNNVNLPGQGQYIDIPYGKPFDVQLQLQWHLSVGSKIDLSIFNENGLDLVIASDYLITGPVPDGSTVHTLQIPDYEVPPHNGHWQLAAKAKWLNQIDHTFGSTMFNFMVNVVGAPGAGPGGNSDWAITGLSTSPVDPWMGLDLVFNARVEVSTTDPLPQTVAVSYSLDGVERLKDWVTYQAGMSFLAVPSPPWTPTVGQHVVRWVVDPDKNYNDPNLANNVMEATFSVTEAPPQPPPQPPGQTPLPPPPAGQAFDFYVTAVPSEQTIQSPVTYVVTVNVTAGTPQTVQLDLIGAPAGVSYYFSPPSGIPSFTSTLTVTAASTVPAGSYPLTINASSVGIVRYTPLVLNIPKGPDYTLSITPDTVQVNPGENATFTVTASSDSGYGQLVNLIASDLPPGSTSQFEPSAVAPTGQSTLTVQLSKDVSPGFYRITVTASGIEGKMISATLQVQGVTSAQATEATVNNLAIGILAIIVALVVVGGILAVKRLRSRHPKQVRSTQG